MATIFDYYESAIEFSNYYEEGRWHH